jgi:sensor c-di-GMP phosphodiesterase-like protein
LSSDRLAGPENTILEVVRFSELPTLFIWLRRELANGSSLAAMVPVELLLPLTAGQGGPFSAWAQITARDGTVIAEGGTPIPQGTPADGVLKATAQSTRFGVTVSTQMSRQHNVQRFDGLWVVATVVNAVIAIGVLMAGWLLLRKSAAHPLADVERALGAKEFIAYYQPIVDITNAKLLGAEVLVRWRKHDGTIVAPAAFVPLLEQGGLIMEMTRQLMRRVSVEVGPAFALRPHLKVSFNLTAAHFADDKVVDDVRAIFEGSQVRLSQVTLELTERQPLHNLTTTRRVIAALQGLGCSIALDDVGTGHSGLSSILRLGVDVIKIDKMFVDSISDEHHSATIIETLVDLARNMRMDVVAEGVENFEQVTHLRERGIRAAQGYIFAPPLPASAFLGLLEAIDPLEEEDSVEQRLRQFAMA